MDRRIMIAAVLLLIACVSAAAMWKPWHTPVVGEQEPPKKEGFAQDRDPLAGAKKLPFDQERALKYVKQFLEIGPRISGSDGIRRQQEIMIKHFETLGGKVSKQEFQAKQKSRKDKTAMTNIIVRWYPEKTKRVILCCHYDTRPIADQEAERFNWNKPFLSANDGTSAVAMMMELAHAMKDMTPNVGVDFVFFDGEEYVFDSTPITGDDYFIGSEYFARDYLNTKAKNKFTYEGAMLFDLCHHDNAMLRVEMHGWAANPQFVQQVYQVAANVGAKSFRFERGHEVRDDHLALLGAGIPSVDIIDFDYAHWHKLSDTIDKVSGKQMAEVAKVSTMWIQTLK